MNISDIKNYGAQMVQQYPHSLTRCVVGLLALGAGAITGDVVLMGTSTVYQGVNWLTATENENHFKAANKVHKQCADDGTGWEEYVEKSSIYCNNARQIIGTVAPAVGLCMMFQDNLTANVIGTALFGGYIVGQPVYHALFGEKREKETADYQQQVQKLGL